MKSMNDTYRLDNKKQILHTKQYVENSKSNLMLKVSQQDNVKKDFTLHLLSRETSNLVILHFLSGIKGCPLKSGALICSMMV